jgi:phosphatidylserine decarboxylase
MQNIIVYWDRNKKAVINEKIVGENILLWLYKTKTGIFVANHIMPKNFGSRIYGWFYDSRISRSKIKPFIDNFDININEFEDCDYNSFNEFFIRAFKPGIRKFNETSEVIPAFSEGRYLGFDNIDFEQTFPVKGKFITAKALMGNKRKALYFKDGPLIIARLAPQDYHRFHFIDSGTIIDSYKIHGTLDSVNPIALSSKGNILCSNKRVITIQKTDNFGLVAYVEVGALRVGKIIQHHKIGSVVTRGEEKGYFTYGGSTVILLGKKGAWQPDKEIKQYTENHMECFIKLGTPIALKNL